MGHVFPSFLDLGPLRRSGEVSWGQRPEAKTGRWPAGGGLAWVEVGVGSVPSLGMALQEVVGATFRRQEPLSPVKLAPVVARENQTTLRPDLKALSSCNNPDHTPWTGELMEPAT